MCIHINVRKYKTRAKIQEFVQSYNNSLPDTAAGRRPLGQMLRQQHVHLIEHLVELLQLEISKTRAMGLGPELGDALPSIRTNTVQLAKRLNCCERTVRGLRDRLKESRVIEAEKWHGTNSGYEIWINRDLLFLASKVTENDNAADFFSVPEITNNYIKTETTFPGRPAARSVQTLPHTVTSKTPLVTKEVNKESGAAIQPLVDNQAVTVKKDVENPKNNGENTLKKVEKPQNLQKTGYLKLVTGPASENPDTSPPVPAAPPKKSPDTLAEVLAGLDRPDALALDRLVQMMTRAAVITLYSDWWIADSEYERIRARLAEYLRYSGKHLWKDGAHQVIERMGLVAKWIKDHYPNGDYKKQLPSIYFDIRNEGKAAFTGTKSWYLRHKEEQRKIHNSILLTKAINEYLRSLEPGAAVGPAEAYRKISQRLNKRDKGLLIKFHNLLQENTHDTAAA